MPSTKTIAKPASTEAAQRPDTLQSLANPWFPHLHERPHMTTHSSHFDAPADRTRPWLQTGALCFALAQAAFLMGCAGLPGGAREHMFVVNNQGDERISQGWIEYGQRRIPFCRTSCGKGGGLGYGVNMPVQEQMTVQWQTADGQTHRVVVPVREKVKDFRRFAGLALNFNGPNLTVLQDLRHSIPGLPGYESIPLPQ